MDLAVSGFALGLLFGAAKVLLIGTVGFGVAWWRTRRRLLALEAERGQPSLTDDRLDRLEQGLDYLASQMDRLVADQGTLTRQLAQGDAPRELARPEPITPH
jgi:hypothetical protein